MRATIHPREIPQTRRYEGRLLLPHEEMLMFHQQRGPVRDTLATLRQHLTEEGIAFVVIGAFALAFYNYERATAHVDICLRPEDLERFRRRFVGKEYQSVEGRSRRFYAPRTQVTFDILVSGTLAGRASRNKVIRFPDPSESVEIGGIPTISLGRLIELKLVTWRFRDWADVVELIRANNLDEDFAEKLDPLVKMAYLECYDQKLEEDRYDAEG